MAALWILSPLDVENPHPPMTGRKRRTTLANVGQLFMSENVKPVVDANETVCTNEFPTHDTGRYLSVMISDAAIASVTIVMSERYSLT